MNAFGRLYYRHRHPNLKRKSGNIADFCRRWGRRYPYMIVLDADSLMSGAAMVRMVRCMERHSDIGILQTTPMLAGNNSPLARVQQFANHLYGPMFAAGLHFWQLGDGQYWGHNAIIRVASFMRHCALPRLSGSPPMGGDILSHDFVEAAMMRRAGWSVWLAYDLPGSYEETPSTLIDELLRDRRWCQGNLQHLRLLLTRGLLPAHRFLFLNGAMSYISALLWFCFIALSTVEALSMALFEPDYFPREGSLFPDWPVWDPSWLLVLLANTMIILFTPKVMGLVLAWRRHHLQVFGGCLRTTLGVLAEIVVSACLAPVRMAAHSKFVAVTLLGRTIGWTPSDRDERGTAWTTAFRFHAATSLAAVIWGSAVFLINRAFFWWIMPIAVPLVLAVPVSVLISRLSLGKCLRRRGLFLSPPELQPFPELMALNQQMNRSQDPTEDGAAASGFVRSVVEPERLCLHKRMRRGGRRVSASIARHRRNLVRKALDHGPDALSAWEKMQLLSDADSLQRLHDRVWELPEGDAARKWGL